MSYQFESPPLPALVVGQVSHIRRTPIRHAFRHRSYQWLVDIDNLPELPFWLRPMATIRAEDHLSSGSSGGGMRGDLAELLRSQGKELDPADRVLMLANARVLGHVFDPLTVFWVQAPDKTVRVVVFEVHNTYGERHSYLLDMDERGRGQTEKTFYVSPFNDTSGSYEVRLRVDPDLVSVTVALDRGGERVLTANTTGVPQEARTKAIVRTSFSHLLMAQRVSFLIRMHGVWLWLRRLPIHARPKQQEGKEP